MSIFRIRYSIKKRLNLQRESESENVGFLDLVKYCPRFKPFKSTFFHSYLQGTKKGLGLSRGRLSALPQVKFDQKPRCVTYKMDIIYSIQCQFINSTEHIIAHNIQNSPDMIKQNYQQLWHLAHRGQAIHATLRMHESPVPLCVHT